MTSTGPVPQASDGAAATGCVVRDDHAGAAAMPRTAAILVAVTAAAGIAGLVREVALAWLMGAGMTTDAFFGVLGAVLMVNDLTAGAALIAGVVPVLAPLGRTGNGGGRGRAQLLTSIGVWTLLATIVIALVMRANATGLVQFVLPGLSAPSAELAVTYLRTMVWLLPCYGLFTLFAQGLTAERRFVLPAVAWLCSHVAFTVTLVALHAPLGAMALLPAVFAGPLLALLVMGRALFRAGLLTPTPRLLSDSVRTVAGLSAPIVLTAGLGNAVGLLMVAQTILRGYASLGDEGSVSALNYAFRLYQAPLTLAAHTTSVMIFPAVSEWARNGRSAEIAGLCRRMLVWALVLLAPACLVVYMAADVIVSVLLHHGALSDAGASATAAALRGFAPAIFGEAVVIVLFRVFYGLRRPWIAAAAGAVCLLSLLVYLEVVSAHRSPFWLASGMSLAMTFAACALVGVIVHRFGREAVPGTRMVVAAIFASTLALAFWHAGPVRWFGADTLLAGVAFPAVAVAVYLGVLHQAAPPADRVRLAPAWRKAAEAVRRGFAAGTR